MTIETAAAETKTAPKCRNFRGVFAKTSSGHDQHFWCQKKAIAGGDYCTFHQNRMDREAALALPQHATGPRPAAACDRCDSWTSYGGMSQFSSSKFHVPL